MSELNEKQQVSMAGYERIVTASQQMTEQEKADLAAWEKVHVTGAGPLGTSDWPGWPEVFARTAN